MTEPRSAEACRAEMADLIRDAVAEPDPARRLALLTLADHWGELVRLRRDPAQVDHGPC